MSYTRLFYHIIWATKDRQPLISEINREVILKAIAAKVIALGGICHAVNAVSDHVHLVATFPPTIPLSTCIGQVKGNSSHLANHIGAHVEGTFAWQDGYASLTVSESHLEGVVKNVLNPQRHHDEGTLHTRLEKIE